MMKCIYHDNSEAEFICSSCGQPVCRECITVVNGKNVCKECTNKNMPYAKEQSIMGDNISGFLFFIYLAIPGLRHMYLGLMKRGLEFLITFFGLIAFGIIIRDGAIIIPLIFIIWFYSAFDSYQLRKLVSRGEKVEDASIFRNGIIDSIKNFFKGKRTFGGILVILLGLYILLVNILRNGYFGDFSDGLRCIINIVLDSMVPVLMIIGGIYLIARAGKGKSSDCE